ncbi:hypothetical protein BS17DRAFT_423803 [Gyrodon lividus]|nr:hypothetical protein BS17DRAFT_423803 [Gyrodon lividus]
MTRTKKYDEPWTLHPRHMILHASHFHPRPRHSITFLHLLYANFHRNLPSTAVTYSSSIPSSIDPPLVRSFILHTEPQSHRIAPTPTNCGWVIGHDGVVSNNNNEWDSPDSPIYTTRYAVIECGLHCTRFLAIGSTSKACIRTYIHTCIRFHSIDTVDGFQHAI